MKKYWLFFLLLTPLLGQAKCTLGPNTTAQQTIEIDMTSGTANVPINTNLNDTFSCNATSDKMYYATPLQGYIVELKEPGSSKSIFMQFNLTGTGFPVATGTDTWDAPAKKFKTQEVINTKPFSLNVSYVKSGKADLTVNSGNTINLGRPAISILTDNTCGNSILSWIVCWALGKLSGTEAYAQNITFTVKHKPTTCRFSKQQYTLEMPETTLNEMLSANNNKSGSTNLVLNCDGIYNVTTNPVNFKVVRGDWNENGTILRNTLTEGAKGVGFQIYNDSATTPLKLGDTLREKLANRATINDQYTFPIVAKYVHISGEKLQPGMVQSKVIFAVTYD